MVSTISTRVSRESARPFLKWAGGKGRHLQQYQSYFPKYFDVYYEPFLGGGAIFFHLLPQQAVLMDINGELVNVYECIRDRVELVIRLLMHHQSHHSSEYYYLIRANSTPHKIEQAARLLYLNRTCFNGLYRENSQGKFNVPMGRYKSPNICNVELLRAASIALKTTELKVQPFDAVLNDAKTNRDFVYFDPPYHPISPTSCFTAYSRYSFNQLDQIRLRDTVIELANRGVKVMLSNSDCPFIRELYKDFYIHTIYANRAINSNAQKRGKITEVLVTSY
jgi:DNA adenine methylase